MKVQTGKAFNGNLKTGLVRVCVSGPRGDLFNVRIIPSSRIMYVRLCKSKAIEDKDLSEFHLKWKAVERFSAGYTGQTNTRTKSFDQWFNCGAIL